MSSTVAESKTRSSRNLQQKHKSATPLPWWGDRDVAPHLRWPGVTIEIPCVWITSRKRWESPDGRYYFDKERAALAVDFFPTFLAHYSGEFAGQPFELLEWQKMLMILPAFGWVNTRTGARRFRIILAFLPKGNGKSPLGSGVGLFLAGCDDEAAAEVFALARNKDQAKVVHDSAKIYVEESADLADLCDVTRDSIYFRQTRSFLKVIPADAPGKHGQRPHGVIVDELHTQKNRDLYETMRKSLAKRRQPMMLLLSHAGVDDESICYEEYEYAREVIKNPEFDEAYLPVIFEATEKDDWTDEAVWRKANPSFGITINPEIFASECRSAQNEPRKKNDFLRFNLNRWTSQATAWLPIEWFDACESVLPADQFLQSLTCCAGLDGAQKIDLFSFVICFREMLEAEQQIEVVGETDEGEIKTKTISFNYRVHLLPHFWIPEDTMAEHEKLDKVPYSQWVEDGLVTATEGATIDYDRIYRDIVKLGDRFPLLKQGQIGYDPAFTTDIALKLRDRGFQMVETPQNYRYLSEPCMVLEALLKAGRIVHNGSRVLRNHFENVAIKRDDAHRIRPVKPKRASKHIDGVSATVTGIGRLIVTDAPTEPQFFFLGEG